MLGRARVNVQTRQSLRCQHDSQLSIVHSSLCPSDHQSFQPEHFLVCFISAESFEIFSLNFVQMFIPVRRCVEPMTQLCRLNVKVTFQCLWIITRIPCPLHISFTPGMILITVWSNVHLTETMCRTYYSATQTQGQGHSLISLDLHLNFVSAPYLL